MNILELVTRILLYETKIKMLNLKNHWGTCPPNSTDNLYATISISRGVTWIWERGVRAKYFFQI